MTNLLCDILREPAELVRVLSYTLGEGRPALASAARLASSARHLYVAGIGSSWHAGMAVSSRFNALGLPSHLVDASELLHFTPIPPGSTIVVLSRSGRSFEILGIMAKAKEAGAQVIAVTNTPASPLAEGAQVVLPLQAGFDHNVSITMYSGLVLIGCLLAGAAAGELDEALLSHLCAVLQAVQSSMGDWRRQIEASVWLLPGATAYFLARGGSLASCHEARLLWEEAAKTPASALTTGGFRHGPQEMIREGVRLGVFIDNSRMRDADLTLIDDMRAQGTQVLAVGQGLSPTSGDLVISIPPVQDAWQPLIDVIPVQIAAERLAAMNGADCDTFRFCPYIVETAVGLTEG